MTLIRTCAHVGLDYSDANVELVLQPINGSPAVSYLLTAEQWLDLADRGRELPPVRKLLRDRGAIDFASAGGGREEASHATRGDRPTPLWSPRSEDGGAA